MGKLINRIPGSRLLISSLPGSALRAEPGKLDIKRHSPSILYNPDCSSGRELRSIFLSFNFRHYTFRNQLTQAMTRLQDVQSDPCLGP